MSPRGLRPPSMRAWSSRAARRPWAAKSTATLERGGVAASQTGSSSPMPRTATSCGTEAPMRRHDSRTSIALSSIAASTTEGFARARSHPSSAARSSPSPPYVSTATPSASIFAANAAPLRSDHSVAARAGTNANDARAPVERRCFAAADAMESSSSLTNARRGRAERVASG